MTETSSLLFQSWNVFKVSLCFILLTFISEEFAFSAFCCFLFLFTLSKPYLISFTTIFVVSTFMDIYSGQFIGLSFCQFIFIYLCILQFRILLLNSRIIFGIYFVFLLLLATEFLGFLITFVLSHKSFDLILHFEHTAVAMFLCCLYCLAAFIKRKIKD